MKNKSPKRLAKEKHETSILEEVLKLFNASNQTNFKIIERPEPPDAIAADGESRMWLELVDAFRSEAEARELWTNAMSTDTSYKWMSMNDPDGSVARSIIAKKLGKIFKDSYKPSVDKFGPGILIICEQDMLFSETTLSRLQEIIEDSSYQEFLKYEYPQSYFKEVYLRFRLSGWQQSGLVRIYPSWGPFIVPDAR